ncbi:MAG: ABC transporter permease [Bacteroidetes bacterium]|nr:ABC transporter permease [Bacteroidota bacterium]
MSTIHLKLALRQLQKNKGFTALNISGLAIGLTTFLLITLYLTDELSYDRWHPNADRIVRLNTDVKSNGAVSELANASPIIAATLRQHYPEVQATTRIARYPDAHFYKDRLAIAEPNVAWADDNVFQFFGLPLIEGDPHTALKDKHSIVLTESAAKRYFNSTHVTGRIIINEEDNKPLRITGVMRDLPQQSSWQFDFLVSIHAARQLDDNPSYFAIYPMSTFVLLRPGTDRRAFDTKLAGLMNNYAEKYAQMEKETNGEFKITLSETPLTDIHLHSHRTDELAVNGSIQYVWIFSAIAVFVLLIAGINFMNLSTARSANRAREVGVRKVLGSLRRQLVSQFLTEALLLTTAATILAVALTWLSLPWFNDLTGKELRLSNAPWLLPSLLLIVIAMSLFSGAYPAFFLSAFKPVQVSKGKLALGGKGSGLRSGLVVLQFSISIFLIVGTLVVFRQLNYIQHRDQGYSRDQMLVITDVDGIPHAEDLKKAFSRLTDVTGVTMTDYLPTGTRRWHNYGQADGKGMYLQTELWIVDADYIPTMDMRIVSGRNFSQTMATDSTAIIINESAARKFGIAGDPLGKTVHYPGYLGGTKDFHVVGVVKDFNYSSVRTNIGPLVLVCRPQDNEAGFAIRIAPGHIPDVLEKVRTEWKAFEPTRAFNYSFMDQDFDAVYRTEHRMGGLIVVLTVLVIFIACLGLFGLAAYAAEQRTKEIGIRKILGAGVPSIIGLLSRDFARLIAIALSIATPLSWWMMHRWLENFVYRTGITAWTFVAAAAIVFSIAALTTIFQSIKAAVANPVDSLRTE